MLIDTKQLDNYVLEHIVKHPADIAQKIMLHFGVSRMTATRHLQRLIQTGLLVKTGKTNNTHYFLASAQNKHIDCKINAKLDEFAIFKQYVSDSLLQLPNNQYEILEYAMTELINNAKDHSNGSHLHIETKVIPAGLEVIIMDNGVGVFYKLKSELHLSDLQEALLSMTKGKVTTDSRHHTGEGIFFSSRAVDIFLMDANGIRYTKDNVDDDWCYEKISTQPGTRIVLTLFSSCQRRLRDVFNAYTNPDSLQFQKTEILIELAKQGEVRFISRSQAKRVMQNLEGFSHIMLDFRGIETVGQGFVDEVFRVYQQKHPHVLIQYRHANENVQFMIERGLK